MDYEGMDVDEVGPRVTVREVQSIPPASENLP